MSNYGERYLAITNFQSFCAELNLRYQPDDSELELYVKEGVLLPGARIIKPNEYVIKHKQTDQQSFKGSGEVIRRQDFQVIS